MHICGHFENVWKSDRCWEPENFENIQNDPWDMLNNFCFHVYAQKLLFIVEKVNAFFDSFIVISSSTLSADIRVLMMK